MKNVNDLTPLMVSTGFSAVKIGSLKTAECIFTSVAELNPQDAAGVIGQATVQIGSGNLSNAITLLEKGIKHADVNVHEARKLLLLAYMLEGDDAKAEELHGAFVTGSERENVKDHLRNAGIFFNQTDRPEPA